MNDRNERRLEYINLSQLKFDPDNPRLPSGRSSERSAVLEYLLESANLVDLMRSIGAQDFFPGEPLLVTDDGDDKYTVIEGNRRYAACHLLSNPADAPVKRRSVEAIAAEAEYRPNQLPCLVLPHSAIVGFLGYRHITGIQEWSPLAKARYLRQLWNGEEGPEEWDERLRWIAKRIGSRSDYVARLLTALALFEEIDAASYYSIRDLDEETLSFSLLALAMNRPVLANYIGLASGQDFDLEDLRTDRLESLTRWFFEEDAEGRTRLGESRNVSALVAVLEDDQARAAFEAGVPLHRAYEMIDGADGSVDLHLSTIEAELETVRTLLDFGGAEALDVDVSILDRVAALINEVRDRIAETMV